MAEGPKLQGALHIKVNEAVTLDNLQGILTRIVGMAGCTSCGLLGIDLRLSGDPAELGQVGKLPGVQSVSFGE